MNARVVSKEEYLLFVREPFSQFETVDFVELNQYKVDEVKYFIFENNKKRFGLVVGIKNKIMELPFSATFSCFSEISKNNKIKHYVDAVTALKNWAIRNNIVRINFSTPPLFYKNDHITKLHNALLFGGFNLYSYDVNHQFDLSKYSRQYLENLSSKARRNLKISMQNNLVFEQTTNIELVYQIIKKNREEKGFPLKMTLDDLFKTSKIIESDCFIVYNSEGNAIASAYVQRITENIVNVVYWGNLQVYDKLCPMNFLSYKIFDFYSKQKNIEQISIGTSTQDTEPNLGLCDFKESIGCECSPKLSFSWEL